jgi:hypothetical protein
VVYNTNEATTDDLSRVGQSCCDALANPRPAQHHGFRRCWHELAHPPRSDEDLAYAEQLTTLRCSRAHWITNVRRLSSPSTSNAGAAERDLNPAPAGGRAAQMLSCTATWRENETQRTQEPMELEAKYNDGLVRAANSD